MAIGKRDLERQEELFVPTVDLARSPGHIFYERLNEVLAKAGFDRAVEELCVPLYAALGRPGIAPGIYFRMMLLGYFEGIESDRGIAWRCSDSLSVRAFLGLALTAKTPDHSSLTRIRQRLTPEVHEAVFKFVLQVLSDHNLLDAEAVGVDGTTLEANAALKSIVRREGGDSYKEYLKKLAKEIGIEEPTQEDLSKLDRKRKKKGSNADWKHPQDPDAHITKMKDGSTHMAYKSEHGVDLGSGAIVAVTLHPGTKGDTSTVFETMLDTCENLVDLGKEDMPKFVADKGYHSNETMKFMEESGLVSYFAEPRRGKRNWEGKDVEKRGTLANRARIQSDEGKALMRLRAEKAERSFAHCLETGGLRRIYLRGLENIRKRYIVHVAGFNLGIVMRKLLGVGTPRGMADLKGLVRACLKLLEKAMERGFGVCRILGVRSATFASPSGLAA